MTQNTGSIEGTVPWITRSVTETTEADKGHVTVTVDRGGRTASTTGEKQFHIGDKVTVNWAIGDTEGDLDNDNTATKGTVVWLRSKSQDGSDAVEISGSAGKDTYTITNDDADYYLGIKIKPTTTTGTPNQAVDFLTLVDLSTNAGGGSNDDDIPEGPVVDEHAMDVYVPTRRLSSTACGYGGDVPQLGCEQVGYLCQERRRRFNNGDRPIC